MTNTLPVSYSMGKKFQVLPLTLGIREVCSLSPLLFNIVLEVLDSNQTRRRNKRHPNWKGRSKMSLFADDMILYIENPKDFTKKLLQLISEFSKVAGCKLFRNQLHFHMPITN